MPVLSAREAVLRGYKCLCPIAQELLCVLVQPELNSEELRNIAFSGLTTADQLPIKFREKDSPPSALLVTSYGRDVEAAKQTCKKLDANPNMPALLAVLLIDQPGHGMDHASAEVGYDLMEVREGLLKAGADEVICLVNGEALMPHRVMEIVQRIDFSSKKMSDYLKHEVADIQQRAARKLQVSYRRFLMKLPGSALENLPVVDATLQERTSQKDGESAGRLVGVGEYQFAAVLGKGCCGTVYMAYNSRRKRCAIKVISKDSLTNAAMMFSLDRELCILLNLCPHPNVTRAFEAMHGESNMYIVMEYGGTRDLHRFTAETLAEAGGAENLPQKVVASFAAQEANAVAHLHSLLVCHRDLKPRNWIVNDAGDRLQLTDFGLATQLCGLGQPLKHGCGSLPFVAPEVMLLRASSNPEAPEDIPGGSYDGLRADVWSLAVNFMELCLGPYSIERRMKWPARSKPTPQELEKLEEFWNGMPEADGDWVPLHGVIRNMLRVDPQDRWTMEQVVGPEGLNLQDSCFGAAERQTTDKQLFGRNGYPVPAVVERPQTPAVPPGAFCLLNRFGGRPTLAAALGNAVDKFLSVPGLSECIDCSPLQPERFKSCFMEQVPELLLVHLQFEERGGDRERELVGELRANIRALHSGLVFLDIHFRFIIEAFESSWRALSAPADKLVEIVARLRDLLRPLVLGETAARSARSRGQHNDEWRRRLFLKLGFASEGEDGQLPAGPVTHFARSLVDAVTQHATLSHTRLRELSPESVIASLRRFVGGDGASDQGGGVGGMWSLCQPLLLDLVRQCDVKDLDHLALVCTARGMLMRSLGSGDASSGTSGSSVAKDDVDMLHLAMVNEWEEAHFARAVARLSARADGAALQEVATTLRADTAVRSCFQRLCQAVAHHEGDSAPTAAHEKRLQEEALAAVQAAGPGTLERIAISLVASPIQPGKPRNAADMVRAVVIAGVPLAERVAP